MISGRGDALRQAWVQLGVRSRGGYSRKIDAIVDTGFDGTLSLPPDIIRELNLESEAESDVVLATGATDRVNTWNGEVLWHGQTRSILILEASGPPLLGMELMEDSQLTMQPRINGHVLIERLDEIVA